MMLLILYIEYNIIIYGTNYISPITAIFFNMLLL